MSVFVGTVVALAVLVLLGSFVGFVFRLSRHAVRDLRNYANDGKTVRHVTPQGGRIRFSAEELKYYRDHAPKRKEGTSA